jgi:hypothetical protein
MVNMRLRKQGGGFAFALAAHGELGKICLSERAG